jgi:hypothetical protein
MDGKMAQYCAGRAVLPACLPLASSWNMLQEFASVLSVNGLLGMCVVRYVKAQHLVGACGMPTFCGPQVGGLLHLAGMLLSTCHVFAAAMLISFA